MSQLIDWDIAKKIAPYFFYSRMSFNAFRGYFTQKIDYGYNYFLRRLWVKYPERDSGNSTLLPDLYVEIFDKANFKSRQSAPIPLDILSTPGKEGVLTKVEVNGQVNMSAKAPLYSKMLNLLYVNGDVIDIEITGQTGGSPFTPSIIDLMLEGYYIPETSVKMWEGQK